MNSVATLIRMHRAAPVLSLAIVLLIPQWLSHEPAVSSLAGSRHAVVAQAVSQVPYRIGSWVGSETPIPESAVKLLRPNALLSRQYRNLDTGATVDLIVVHCGDARDMLGHYPPVCYPSAGWVFTHSHEGEPVSSVALDSGIRTITARQYRFSRIRDWSSEHRIRIFNFFVLPDGSLSDDIDAVSERTGLLGAAIDGVAQVQLLTEADVSDDEARAAATEILTGLSDLFIALGVKKYE